MGSIVAFVAFGGHCINSVEGKTWGPPFQNGGAYGNANAVMKRAQALFAERGGYRYRSGGHSAADVPVYAVGVGAERFAGRQDNTAIAKTLRDLLPDAAE